MVIEKEDKYVMQTYGRYNVVIDKGQGAKVWDIDGKEYIDMTSGIGVNSLGHAHKELTEALKAQIDKLMHMSNLYYNKNTADLGEKLVLLSGNDMSKVFFANSGAEANEGAIKVARKYSEDKYGEGRKEIISLKDSFHGRTVTTLAATGQDKFHKYFGPFPEGFVYYDKDDVEGICAKIKSGKACAIIMEAIQGESGVHPLNKENVKKICEVAKQNDVLVIFDEVQCGIGRTGKLYGFEWLEVVPDIITLAKGLGGGIPIGAFLCNTKLENVLGKGDHGTTFGGNPLATSAGLVVLSQIEKQGFLEEVNKKGQYIMEKLNAINSSKVKEVRGRGLMIGIDVEGELGAYVNQAIEKGLIVLTAGKSAIRLLPPLVITYEEIDKTLEILEGILK